MKKGNIYTFPFRRKRQGKTHYKKRIKMLLSSSPRFIVRKSLNNIEVSLADYNPKGDKIFLTVSSKALAKLGWKADNGNVPSAYLSGYFAGKKALQKGIKHAVLDIGLGTSIKGSRVYAAVAGAIDAGLKIPCSSEVLPSKERITGEHIAKYASLLKKDREAYEKRFANYLKRGLAPEELANHFNQVRGKLNE